MRTGTGKLCNFHSVACSTHTLTQQLTHTYMLRHFYTFSTLVSCLSPRRLLMNFAIAMNLRVIAERKKACAIPMKFLKCIDLMRRKFQERKENCQLNLSNNNLLVPVGRSQLASKNYKILLSIILSIEKQDSRSNSRFSYF